MGLLDRLRRVTAARVSAFLDQVEDPAAAVCQLLGEFNACLLDLERAEAKSVSALKAAQRRHDEAEGRRHRYVYGADLALRAGDETTTREALAAQFAVERELLDIDDDLARTVEAAEGTRRQQAALRCRILELEARAEQLSIERERRVDERRASRRQERQQRLLNEVARMEVTDEEGVAATADLTPETSGSTLDERLRYLVREREVEKRLVLLRRVVADNGETPTTATPAAPQQVGTKPEPAKENPDG